MCGVVGFFAYHPDAPAVDEAELVHARDTMVARGPDDVGVWLDGDRRVGLGHRRLAVIDLSDRARQPMRSTDGTLSIVFNGEIYNYRALRAELEAEGRHFRTESDTEVLLHLYASRGHEMFDRIRGMYAFILWDAARAELILARDPYGIKPLYYADDGRTFRAASQLRTLDSTRGATRELDPAGVAGFYLFGSVPEPFTIRKGVSALPAGCYLRRSARGITEVRAHFSVARTWERAAAEPTVMDRHSRADAIREALIDSVKHHLVADVPVAAFLSGGIDSTTLVTHMRTVAPAADLTTLTLAFDEFRGTPQDEAPVAELVARNHNTTHVTRRIATAELAGLAPQILRDMDQPTVDGINTWLVSMAAREQRLKVAISGLGGDELFAGYPSTFKTIPRLVRALGSGVGATYLASTWQRFWQIPAVSRLVPVSPKIAGLLRYGGTYEGAYLLRRGLFMPWELPDIMGTELAREALKHLDPMLHVAGELPSRRATAFVQVAGMESGLYMRNQLLRDSDWASMAHSLELRVPLVDATLLQRLAPIFAAPSAHVDKRWLADSATPSLPAAVLSRPKTGFGIPIGQWLLKLDELASWREHQKLRAPNCHWSRRLAYALIRRASGP